MNGQIIYKSSIKGPCSIASTARNVSVGRSVLGFAESICISNGEIHWKNMFYKSKWSMNWTWNPMVKLGTCLTSQGPACGNPRESAELRDWKFGTSSHWIETPTWRGEVPMVFRLRLSRLNQSSETLVKFGFTDPWNRINQKDATMTSECKSL